jgi:hypothetical protein
MKIHQFIDSKYLKMTLLRGVTSYIVTNVQMLVEDELGTMWN